MSLRPRGASSLQVDTVPWSHLVQWSLPVPPPILVKQIVALTLGLRPNDRGLHPPGLAWGSIWPRSTSAFSSDSRISLTRRPRVLW